MVMDMNHTSVLRIRNEAELKLGISKKFMLAGSFFMSDALNGTYRPEGGNLYGQYRFYSADDIHSHLRMAGFGRLALSGDPLYYDAPFSYYVDHGYGLVEHTGHAGYISESIDLGGSNSGFETGMIITHRTLIACALLAFSSGCLVMRRIVGLAEILGLRSAFRS